MDMITLAMAKAYTDKKAGYTETEKVYICNNITVPKGTSNTVYAMEKNLVAGETYTVVINGTEYERVCMTVPNSGETYLGNAYLNEFPEAGNNGDEFGITYRANCRYFVAFADTTIDNTISVYQKKETVHTIDPKFLPPVDSITMNGADGKQYKLTVNNGSISVAEVV